MSSERARRSFVQRFRLAPRKSGRAIVPITIIVGLTIAGCSHLRDYEDAAAYSVAAEPLNINLDIFNNPALTMQLDQKRAWLSFLVLDSERKCGTFLNRLAVAQSGINATGDVLAGGLSVVAAAVSPLSLSHAFSTASTIVTGSKLALNEDLWAKAAMQDYQKALQSSYYSNVRDYITGLEEKRDINLALEIPKIQAIHDQCTLPAARNVISTTLSSPADAAPRPSSSSGPEPGSTRVAVPGMSLRDYAPLTGKSTITPTALPKISVPGTIGAEKAILFSPEVVNMQNALCISPPDGKMGRTTRAAVQLFRSTAIGNAVSKAGVAHVGPETSNFERAFLESTPACDRQCFGNAYEYYQFGVKVRAGVPVPADQTEKNLKNLFFLLATVDGSQPPGATFCDPATKGLIRKVLPAIGEKPDAALTAPIFEKLSKEAALKEAERKGLGQPH